MTKATAGLTRLARPMSDKDLEAKFQALAAPVLPNDRIGELVGLSWNADSLGDVGVIARAAAQRSESGL